MTLEYIFRTRDPKTAIFWVYASSPSTLVDSYKRIASECKIPGFGNPDLDTMQLVRDWLETQRSWHWLMIVDNVDDRTMFFEPRMATDKLLIEYLPRAVRGTVIYTTRSRDIGADLLAGDEPIHVFPTNTDEALSVLGETIA